MTISVQDLCDQFGGVPQKYARRYLRQAAKRPGDYPKLAEHVKYERWVWEKDSPAHREALQVFEIICKRRKWPSSGTQPQTTRSETASSRSAWNVQVSLVNLGGMFSKSSAR